MLPIPGRLRARGRDAKQSDGQQAPPPKTLKKLSMSESVPVSPSPLKSALPQVAQQLPERQAKKAPMSASVPRSPSSLKSAEQAQAVRCSVAWLWNEPLNGEELASERPDRPREYSPALSVPVISML